VDRRVVCGAASEAHRIERVADVWRRLDARRPRRHADEAPREDEDREVAVALHVATLGREHEANGDIAVGEVSATELDVHVFGFDVLREYAAERVALRHAVVRREHEVVGDQRSGTRHGPDDSNHRFGEQIVGDVERRLDVTRLDADLTGGHWWRLRAPRASARTHHERERTERAPNGGRTSTTQRTSRALEWHVHAR